MAALPALRTGPGRDWDELPGIVLVLDRDAAVLDANVAFGEFFAIEPDAVHGSAWQQRLADASRLALRAAVAEPHDFTLSLELVDADGTRRFVDCAGRWLAGAAHFVCLLHDVTATRRALSAAQDQGGLFRLLADNVPVQIAYFRESDQQCRYANSSYAKTFGRDGKSIIGMTFDEVIGAEAARRVAPEVRRYIEEQRSVVFERPLELADGEIRTIEVNLLPHVDADGHKVGTFVLISDITKHRRIEQALRESEERLAKFMQATAEGIAFLKSGVIVDANPALCALSGYRLDELLGHRAAEFTAPDQLAKLTTVVASGSQRGYETVLLDKQGQRIPVELIVRTMLHNGESMRMTIVRDIRDRHSAQARIHHMAHHDALTGLPNRMSFMEHLDYSMRAARVEHGRLALLFVDLDHFKRVNDSLGHMVGDALLRTLAGRIVGALRATDVVARFGGDEFMVLVPGLPSDPEQRADAGQVAQKLISTIEAPVYAEGRPLSVTPSIGIALYPGDGDTPTELIERADSAMYRAKAHGRANYQFFDPEMATSAYAALVMEGELGEALERNEFELYYQPQVRARDGGLVGAEALIRWNHPTRGVLPPDEFIPIAEQRRLMLAIGQWVLRNAALCAVHWHAMGLEVAPVAVNLSTVQFHSTGFIEAVAQVLPEGSVGFGLLELELTERMLMDDLADVKQRLMRLKALGLRISVDDFGTGYSSLGHLKELPIDKVKIDRSFIQDLPANRDSAAITRAIVQMGHSLGLTVIAEGVENEAQSMFLSALGCDELQGLWVGAPMPAAQFEAWVVARRNALAH